MNSEPRTEKCRKWQIVIGEFVLGTVDERDRARLERHLARCESCRRRLAETEQMYRLLGDFELAQPGPFFAAKVAGAVRSEAEARTGRPETPAEKALTGARRWMLRPGLAGAVAAACVAVVAAVLYVKVWLPRAGEGVGVPVAGKIAEAKGEMAAAPEEKEAAGAEERRLAERVKPGGDGGAAGLKRPGILSSEELADVAAYAGGLAEETARGAEKIARAEERPAPEPPGPRPEAGARDETALRRGDIAAAGKAATRTSRAGEKEEVVAEERRPTPARSVADELTTAPLAATAAGRGGTAGASAFGRVAVDAETRPSAGLESETLTKADVEAWMDARVEADVERLTTAEDTALVEYVTPNGLLMTYFYELPVEEQRMLLSRLRRKAEAATAAEILFSH